MSQAQGAPALPPARFSLGAGLGYSIDVGAVGGLGGLGGLGTRSGAVTPTGIALFEVAVTHGVRLMLGASGSYSKRLRVPTDEPDTSPRASWVLGGGVGVRWVLNPGGRVEFSPALLLGIHGGRIKGITGTVQESNGISYMTKSEEGTLGYDARLGVVLEYALLANLHLRFEAYFLRAGIERTARRTNGLTTRNERLGLNWGLAPSLILRMAI